VTNLAKIIGLFQRGRTYYLRIVLPLNHPLIAKYKSGRHVRTLGICDYRDAVKRATLIRAEILCGYVALDHKQNPPALLRDVYERWCKAKPRTEDSVACCGRALRHYEAQTPNPPLELLTRNDGDQFRGWLLEQPTTSKTARDRLIWICSLLKYACEDLELIPKNPWQGLDIKSRPTLRRTPWDKENLDKLLTNEIWQLGLLPKDKKAGGIAIYWIPLLALFTGARCAELCQLETKNIQVIDGVPVIVITDGGEGQRLKTWDSERIIPIHSSILELGFMDYVNSQKSPLLWNDLIRRKERPGGIFSQYFGMLRKRLGIPPHIVLHSFRHLFRSELVRKQIPERTIDLLLGHQTTGSVGSQVYTHVNINDLKWAVEQFQPDIRVPKITGIDGKLHRPCKNVHSGDTKHAS
jgi:integrase